MKRTIIFSLLALVCTAMQAQQNKNVKVLAKSFVFMAPCPEAVIDKKTKKKTVEWPSTENNSWHDNMGIISNVPVEKNIDSIFPDNIPSGLPGSYSYHRVMWQLTEEDGQTVLHCYFRMPADVVNNLWLASEECVILDKQTGTIYQSRGTEPDCYKRVFSVKGKEGDVLDFKIFFPPLAPDTKDIAIYGVPNWYLRGMDVSLQYHLDVAHYDTIPKFHHPHLVSPAKDYNKDNFQSWAVYDDPHLIKPVAENTLALWLTPEATYMAVATEMNWMREYFGRGTGDVLMDSNGHQYKLKEMQDYPTGPMFWMEGCSGDYFAIVHVFEPLPLYLDKITYIVPEGEPFAMWGASWEGKVQPDLDIKTLRANQHLFQYHPRVVKK